MADVDSREELVALIAESYSKLKLELDSIKDPEFELGDLICIDEWTVKDLLAVRVWWTKSVLDWIEKGRSGKTPVVPARGYTWKETPRLNSDIIAKSQSASLKTIRNQLDRAVHKVFELVESLDGVQLLEAGVFEWAGKWPIARWLSINTARQFTTAQTHIRRAIRNAS